MRHAGLRERPLREPRAVPRVRSHAAERVGRAQLRARRRHRGPSPAADRRRRARDAERAERLRADHAVDLEPAPRLEAADRGARDRAVDAVGADAERALHRHRGRGGRRRPARAAAPAAERAARDRADDAVDLEPAGGLERAHRAPRLAAEDAVGRDAERALGGRDVGPAAAELEVAAGDRAGLGALGARRLVGRRDHGRGQQRGRDERALAAVHAAPPRGGGLAPPQRAGQRALPQLGSAEVPHPGRLRADRPAVVVQRHGETTPGAADGLSGGSARPRRCRRRPCRPGRRDRRAGGPRRARRGPRACARPRPARSASPPPGRPPARR